jgi:hypothetical protein
LLALPPATADVQVSKFREVNPRQIARPFDWTFARADVERVLAKISEREPRLALAA